jgi:aminoglycoside 3-N-acetyltransferase
VVTPVVTRADIAAGLRRLGIGQGDIVFFHSSLKSLGRVDGGPEAVIAGLLEATGPAGTVVAPVFTLTERLGPFGSWYHHTTTPSTVGLITETLRRRPDAQRSFHPIHSVAAAGRLARFVTAEHRNCFGRVTPWCDAGFAQGSPLDLLARWNAWYVLLGVSFDVQTIMHYVETILADGVVRRATGAARDRLRSGIRRWGGEGVWPSLRRPPLGERLVAEGVYATIQIGAATVRGAHFQPILGRALEIVLGEPEAWLNPAFREWMGEPPDPAALLAEYLRPGGAPPLAAPAAATSCAGARTLSR